MNNVVITGSYPPDVCGIGDYVHCLMNTVEASGWKLFYKKKWSIYMLIPYIVELLSLKPNKIFLQYPAQGYGWSIVPHLLCLFFSCFTNISFIPVLHEYSELRPKSKFVLNIVIFSTKKMVVTNIFEKNAILLKNIRLNNCITVIKIFSNIESSKNRRTFLSRYYDIIYFGQIRPNKGLEMFISEIIKYKAINSPARVAIIGAYPQNYQYYLDNIIKIAGQNNIKMIINHPSAEIAELLNNSKILFLPFPDGCSERRGSYLSGLKNGCVVVTTKGKYTTNEMLKTAFFVSEEDAACSIFNNILFFMDEDNYLHYVNNVNLFLQKEMPHSWNEIATEYNRI
jgi:glycosyltransferase involved in cell wall biosynthesis